MWHPGQNWGRLARRGRGLVLGELAHIGCHRQEYCDPIFQRKKHPQRSPAAQHGQPRTECESGSRACGLKSYTEGPQGQRLQTFPFPSLFTSPLPILFSHLCKGSNILHPRDRIAAGYLKPLAAAWHGTHMCSVGTQQVDWVGGHVP